MGGFSSNNRAESNTKVQIMYHDATSSTRVVETTRATDLSSSTSFLQTGGPYNTEQETGEQTIENEQIKGASSSAKNCLLVDFSPDGKVVHNAGDDVSFH